MSPASESVPPSVRTCLNCRQRRVLAVSGGWSMSPAKPSGQRQDTRHAAKYVQKLAMNPCPCGNHGVRGAECICPPMSIRRYSTRLSGPLRDRIDIDLQVSRVAASRAMSDHSPSMTTAQARERVAAARERAARRWMSMRWRRNAEAPGTSLRQGALRLAPAVRAPLDRALERGALTLRGYDRVLRVAWTMADLAELDRPGIDEVGRALLLRRGLPR
ncbi:ATP-binding protein [Microbacterium maritypicum]|uniref:magnesium chelatase subunit ChlI family protein n=1 Tax=Microbacterium maritypicum TaxID=33918 RepID=UPI003F4F89A3